MILSLRFSKLNRAFILLLCFVLVFSFSFSVPAHAELALAIGIGAAVIAFGAAVGACVSYSNANSAAQSFGNNFISWCNASSVSPTAVLAGVTAVNGALNFAQNASDAFSDFWSDYVTDNSITDTPLIANSGMVNGFIVNPKNFNYSVGVFYNSVSFQYCGFNYIANLSVSSNSIIYTVYKDNVLVKNVTYFSVDFTSPYGICLFVHAMNSNIICLGCYCISGSSGQVRDIIEFSKDSLIDSFSINTSSDFIDNQSYVQTQTETETYVVIAPPQIYSNNGTPAPTNGNNVDDVLSALLTLGALYGLYDALTGDIVPNTPTPTPTPSSEPTSTPSPQPTSSTSDAIWMPEEMFDIFGEDGLHISGIWHYVTEWLSSIASGASLIFTVFTVLPWAMVVPIYASIVIFIVFGIFRRLR